MAPDSSTGGVAHLLVVLLQVALHAVHVALGKVDAAARTVHDPAGRHDATGHRLELSVDDVGDQQLVGGEVVLVVAVIPDVGVAVLLVGLVLCVGPLADSFLRSAAVPFAVPISER
jgi:hypothetical protein